MQGSDTKPWDNIIYLVRAGSHAYGTDVPESDIDLRGICIPPAEYIVGLHNFEQYIAKEPDTVIYGIHKFFNLALACNPNIVELLYVRDTEIVQTTEAGQRIRENRNLFLSKNAFKTFGGYAYAQLKRLDAGSKSPRHGAHHDLIQKHGMDTKNALHLIRLFRTGVELLREGTVHTYRPDREELLAIRNGNWTLEQIHSEAERLDNELKLAYDNSILPSKPDYKRAEKLLMELVRPTLEGYYNASSKRCSCHS